MKVQLTINGQSVTAESGQTILEAAQAAGIEIPTLCHHPAVSSHGACRMCLVEVKGMRGLQTSCTCPVADGLVVETETETVIEGRKFALQLLFSERNHYCMVCQMSGDCELQELAYQHGLDHWRYPRPYRKMEIDASHPYIIVDPNRCILCTRCVRACDEIAANHTLGLRERGSETMICADVNVPLGESTCVSCGVCLQVCPTGALIDALSAYGGHEEDLTHTRTTCTQCSVGCTLDVVTRGSRLLRVDGVWQAAPSAGLLCVDGRFKPLYEERERVAEPLVRRNGKLVPSSWEEALALAARHLREGTALGLAACATSDEALAAFAASLKGAGGQVRRLEPVAPALGYGEPAELQDILDADFIVVAGADPLNDQKVVGYFIKRAVDRGAQLALIGEPANGLADYATLVVPCAEASTVAEMGAQAVKVVVVYGAGIEAEVIEALQPLADRVCFLSLDLARNGKGAEAAGLVPLDNDGVLPHDTLYLLLGDQREEDGLVERLNGHVFAKGEDTFAKGEGTFAKGEGTFTIVQASYRSPLVERADVVLPAPIWAERTGHFTNVEDRVLPLNAALPLPEGVRDDAEVLAELADLLVR